ncbi:MAG: M1 family peptidase, partial [Vicingaceae bacterium]
GLNTFCQYLAEKEWDVDYPSRRGPAYKIVDYMKGNKENISPIMTNSESIIQFGNNAYGKPATALNILRETIMGRELFDYAFKQYATHWMFKHPTPADFFRIMEDASAVDLDWFWRGWFFTTDHVDLAIDEVKWYRLDTKNPDLEFPKKKADEEAQEEFIGDVRNEVNRPNTVVEQDPTTKDFYNTHDPFKVTSIDRDEYKTYIESLEDEEKSQLEFDQNIYEVQFSSPGGLLMPIILEFTFTDDSNEKIHIPAEIWKTNHKRVSKVFIFEKEVKDIVLDPNLETADVDRDDNYWPPRIEKSRFSLFKEKQEKQENEMQRAKRAK